MTQNLDRFKFRVVIKERRSHGATLDNGIYDVVAIYCDRSDLNHDRKIIVFHNNKRFEIMEGTYDFELMQCTGLKDKNGKLIYEGDVIECDHYEDLYAVIYLTEGHFSGGFCLKNLKTSQTSNFHQFNIWMPSDEPKNWDKIIGNIYENADLLK